MVSGEVWLVGAGPGDPGLLTVKGAWLLGRADVVVYDRLVDPALLSLAPQAELIEVGKGPHGSGARQQDINDLLVARARAGKKVLRLKGGDPFIFGRGGEEALALAEAGIPFCVVPGVTAASGCGAYAGIPLTHRHLSSSLCMATGHEEPGKDPQVDFRALARADGTVVVYMGVGRLEYIVQELLAGGRDGQEPAALVQKGTRANQRVVVAALGELVERAREEKLSPPALLIVGRSVSLRSRLDWYSRLPLAGCRIALTRPRFWEGSGDGRAAPDDGDWGMEEARWEGAEVQVYHLLGISPCLEGSAWKALVRELNAFTWILFTSVFGVFSFFSALWREGRDSRTVAGCRVGAVGGGTAAALARWGVRPDLVANPHTVEALVGEVGRRLSPGDRLLLPRSDLAASQADVLRAAGAAEVVEVAAYHTVFDGKEGDRLARNVGAGEIDMLVLTSASSARAAAAALGNTPPRGTAVSPGNTASCRRAVLPVVAIGPATAAAAREAGLSVAEVAAEHDRAGLLQAVRRAWQSARRRRG